MSYFDTRYPNFYKKQHKKRKKSSNISKKMCSEVLKYKQSESYKVVVLQNEILPKNFIIFLRRKYKKFFKKNKIKFYLQIQTNYMVSCKNKNSRMGKGVGSIKRVGFFKKNNSVFIEVFNISPRKLQIILEDFRKRTNIKTFFY